MNNPLHSAFDEIPALKAQIRARDEVIERLEFMFDVLLVNCKLEARLTPEYADTVPIVSNIRKWTRVDKIKFGLVVVDGMMFKPNELEFRQAKRGFWR